MSRSWKVRRSPATSFPVVCRAVLLFLIGLSNRRPNLVCRRIYTPNSHPLAHRMAEDFHAVTARRAKCRETMIGQGTQSTNQRRHNYVQENVRVGFFTDPTVCIGCKACEVACKEWNEVPDDGFTWIGNSYDNTGRLGASTWRHVLFLEQACQKRHRITGLVDLSDARRFVRPNQLSSAASTIRVRAHHNAWNNLNKAAMRTRNFMIRRKQACAVFTHSS